MSHKTTKYAIVNGHIIDPGNSRIGQYNIVVENGIITEIGPNIPDIPKIDASNKIVTPGFIDLHTHLREPGYEYKEDIESGSNAAIAGGYTSILCMANTRPVNDNIEVTRYIKGRSNKIDLIKLYPVGAISIGLLGKKLADIEGMAKEGVMAISDDGNSVSDEKLMQEAMGVANHLNLLVICHPEDFCKNGLINEGHVASSLGLPGLPAEAENSIIERDIRLASKTGARLHIAHVSTAKGIELVHEAKDRGIRVTCEVTPHHITLTEDDVVKLGPNAKMKPPLRTMKDRMALIRGINEGVVDAIATDHAPHAPHEKRDIKTASFGVIGMETTLPLCLKLVQDSLITIEDMVRLLTIGPAKVLGIKAGSLSVGMPADISIFDSRATYQIDSSNFKSKSRNTPFDGWRVKGKIHYTIVNGKIVYQI